MARAFLRGHGISHSNIKTIWTGVPGSCVDDDHYRQPSDLFGKMSPDQWHTLFDNTVRAVGGAAMQIQVHQIANCAKGDLQYGDGVATTRVHLAAGKPLTLTGRSHRI
ncbi:catalase-related domain-containing protein [Mesorhizobium sp. M0571]|uniref:catalase-related domain-containing protein n=1 Tax=Mesorhizobium sp. M0571 TaxID=2956960 RepID=UPI00333BE27D